MNAWIKKRISFKVSVQIVTALNIVVIIFHGLVLVQIIPFDVVWGGRLSNLDEMRVFETVSIMVNAFLISIVSIKAGRLKLRLPLKLINGILWMFIVLFTLNTIGNLNAINSLEMMIATPLTALLATLCWRIAIE